jgi:hypothetical protein
MVGLPAPTPKMPKNLLDFVQLAVYNATRLALQEAKFLPLCEGAMLVVREKQGEETELIGVRVYFEPPVEAIYWLPNNTAAPTVYNDAKKAQAPLDCSFYVFTVEGGVIGSYTIYQQPTV